MIDCRLSAPAADPSTATSCCFHVTLLIAEHQGLTKSADRVVWSGVPSNSVVSSGPRDLRNDSSNFKPIIPYEGDQRTHLQLPRSGFHRRANVPAWHFNNYLSIPGIGLVCGQDQTKTRRGMRRLGRSSVKSAVRLHVNQFSLALQLRCAMSHHQKLSGQSLK